MPAKENRNLTPVFGKQIRHLKAERNFILVNMPVRKNGEITYVEASFPIENLTTIELSKEFSAIITPQGTQIPVHLSHDGLLKLLSCASGKTDMTLITGKHANLHAPNIQFASQSDVVSNMIQENAGSSHVKIKVFVLPSGASGCDRLLLTFYDNEIDFVESKVARKNFSSDTSGWTYFVLKNRTVFSDEKGFWIEMSTQKFMEKLNLAQIKGVGHVDLLEETRVKTSIPRRTSTSR